MIPLGAIGGLFGLNPLGKAAKAVGGLVTAVAVLLLLWGIVAWIRADAYADGERDTDLKWQAASERLKEQAIRSAGTADTNAGVREQQFTTRLAQEKEKVDEAVSNGADPFGPLFPARVQP